MVDRLSELRKGAAKVSSADDVVIDIDQSDSGKIFFIYNWALESVFDFIYLNLTSYWLIPALVGGGSNGGAFMQRFFADVEYIKRNILVIRTSTTRVGEINQQASFRPLVDRQSMRSSTDQSELCNQI